MKKLFSVFALALCCVSCDELGIGKQCYSCTTISYTSNLREVGRKNTDICGKSDMEKFTKENTGNQAGLILQTNCTSK